MSRKRGAGHDSGHDSQRGHSPEHSGEHGDGHEHGHPAGAPLSLHLFSPSGVLALAAPLTRAARRLAAQGFHVVIDPQATARHQRFAGDDEARLAALHGVARAAPSVALATRGGYGLTRLMDRLD